MLPRYRTTEEAKNTVGWLGLAKYWFGQIAGLRAMDRPFVRNSTDGSPKWKTGHNVGCTMRAPEGVCICKEFKRRPSEIPASFC